MITVCGEISCEGLRGKRVFSFNTVELKTAVASECLGVIYCIGKRTNSVIETRLKRSQMYSESRVVVVVIDLEPLTDRAAYHTDSVLLFT